MSKKALTDPTGENNGATGVIGHYTQAVWAETTDVGCGYIASAKGSVSEIQMRVFVAWELIFISCHHYVTALKIPFPWYFLIVCTIYRMILAFPFSSNINNNWKSLSSLTKMVSTMRSYKNLNCPFNLFNPALKIYRFYNY